MIENKRISLFLFLALKAVILCFLISFYQIHLAPDEAQYWTWSQKLDWGYYSKPPAIAWQIALTTALFGNSELGVRFGAIIIGFCLPWILFFTVKKMGLSEKTAFWAAVMLAFSPLGIFLSFAATTDGGATLFFTLAICFIAWGLVKKQGPSYVWIGIFIGLGALYKWTAFFAWPFIFLFLPFYPSLRKKSLILGVILSLIALTPTIYWNIFNDWATFKHVGSTLVKDGVKKGGNFWDFLAAQIGLISPIYFVLLGCSLCALYKRKNRFPPLVFCGTVTLAICIFFAIGLFKKLQPNWAVYLYPVGFCVAAWWGCEERPRMYSWIVTGTWLSIFLMGIFLWIPWVQSNNIFYISYKLNPFRQNMGWEKIATILQDVGYNPKKDFLFGDKYQSTSLLSFYGSEQKRAYFFNLNKQRKNQFSYWPQMTEEQKGNTGYFVILENMEENGIVWFEKREVLRLSPYFEQIDFLGAFPIFQANGIPVKYAIIFRCLNYNGHFPEDPEIY